ncbi:MAG TPA: hypothetical protein VE783_00125 [Candidatus Limnocylindrales bacterium]|nr:hypothetical protein [Candidatus Limnocylindrales bacterium]
MDVDGAPPISLVPISCAIRWRTGTRPWESVGNDLDEAIAARERKQAYFEALNANVPVVQNEDDAARTKITDAVYQWFSELQLFQGKDQQGKSEKRCGRTTTALDSSSISRRRKICVSWIRSIASNFCVT